MKKIFFIAMIILVALTGCGSKLKSYEEIDYNTFIEKMENNENFALFIGSSTCQHCDAFKVTVKNIVKKYQIKIYYIDIHKFDDEQSKEFNTYINFNATPTTVFIENGVEKTDDKGNKIYRINGNLRYDKVVEKLTKVGYIKE